MACYRLLVSGRVQGVFFRKYSLEKASSLGLTGWVRNRLSGEVEISIQGEESCCQAMIEWCQTGSPRSIVSSVSVTQLEGEGLEWTEFLIEETV